MSELPEYEIVREFDAPRSTVWRAWTDPEILHNWYGPGVETTIHKFDLKAGGTWLNEMKWGDKQDFSRMDFLEVVDEEKLVWHHSSTDGDWNIISNSMMPNWPRVLLTTVTFEDAGEKTSVRLTQVPVNGTDEEIACFAEAMSNMDHGWGAGYKVLDGLLANIDS